MTQPSRSVILLTLTLALILAAMAAWSEEGAISLHLCPYGDEYYLKDVDLDGDGLPELRLMGRVGGAGQLQDPVVVMHMERGRTGSVSVSMGGRIQEITSLEFWGRWKSPCEFLAGAKGGR